MALTLPANFEADLQSRDTNLFPVIVIGNSAESPQQDIYLSTNQFTISNIGGAEGATANFKPLLLNIPSLKESIDIEKRNYKISSVNIDISNLPYEGKRFSELVEGKSLINTECRIFWISPSVGDIVFIDVYGFQLFQNGVFLPEYDNIAFQVYSGTIRRYTNHDDEKVRLVVEDRSQATLHRDLPLESAGTENVPDKYKNQYIPIVYGSVDRSPLIPYYANIVEETGNVTELQLRADNRAITTPDGFVEDEQIAGGNATLPISALYFFDNDQYWNVTKEDDEGNVNFVYSVEDTGSIIRLDVDTVMGDDADTIINNDFSRGTLGIYVIRQIKRSEYIASQLGGAVINTEFEDIDMGKITGTVDVDTGFTEAFSSDHSAAFFRLTLDDAMPQIKLALDSDGNELPTHTDLYLNLTHYNYGTGEGASVPLGEAANINEAFTNWKIMKQDQGWNSVPTHVNYQEPYSNSFNSIYGTDYPLSILFPTINSYQWLSVGILKQNHHAASNDYSVNVNFTLHDAFLVHRIFVNGVADKEYYANVNGRMTANPNMPLIIADIMDKELGFGGITDIAGFDSINNIYSNWNYAFTLDSKINSKRLIEGIASASPYIPRFDNMGNFKFDVIYWNGGSVTSDNHHIKEADVISFSVSRTPIEQIFSKIIFKYNWDYARGQFQSSHEVEIGDILDDYDFDYYGLEDDHSESTLVIDDDRGKYIRQHFTAARFASWYLLWSCNQKLKLKITLPLKMMFLEIGDIVEFDAIMGGVKPYGIDYARGVDETVNFQKVYSNFLIVSTNKTLNFCEIECIQLPDLYDDFDYYEDEFIDSNVFYGNQSYYVHASNDLNGVNIDQLIEFDGLQNLQSIQTFYPDPDNQGEPMSAQWHPEFGLIGSSFQIVGGNSYVITFSQYATTELFEIFSYNPDDYD